MEPFNIIQSWLDNVAYSHSPSKSTRRNYTLHINKFCKFIDKTPQQIIDEYEESTDKVFRRRYARYVRALIAEMTHQGYATNSINAVVTTIKSFFKYNDLPLAHVSTSRNQVQYHNRDISKEEIVSILQASSPRDKAFFAMMAQGGFRPHIICSLKIKDIQPDFEKGTLPCCVKVRQEINKGGFGSFFTFIGEESVKYLKAYLSTRFHTTPEDLLFMSRGTTKPLNPKSLSHIFNHILTKLKEKGTIKLEESRVGKPGKLRLYNLRKYFRKYARPAGVDYANYWMGHKSSYQAPNIPSSDDSYFSKSDIEFQRGIYAKDAAPHLRLETLVRTAVGERMELLSSKVETLTQQLHYRNTVIKALKKQVDAIPITEEEIEEYRASIGLVDLEKSFNDLKELYETLLKAFTEEFPKMQDRIKDLEQQLKKKKPK